MGTLTAPRVTNPASWKQLDFIKKLLNQRQVDPTLAAICREQVEKGTLTGGRGGTASEMIEWLMRQPFVSRSGEVNADPVTEPGIYEHNGEIFQVKRTRDKQRLYAKRLTMTIGDALRLTASGATVKAAYEYAPGAFSKIQASNRITGARAEELSIVFSNCIVCGRTLKAADSVARSIGPVCITKV